MCGWPIGVDGVFEAYGGGTRGVGTELGGAALVGGCARAGVIAAHACRHPLDDRLVEVRNGFGKERVDWPALVTMPALDGLETESGGLTSLGRRAVLRRLARCYFTDPS
jgi:hypothetical protein